MKTIEDIKDVILYLRRSQGDDLNILEKHELEGIALCERMGWSYIVEKEIGSADSIDDRPVFTEILDTVEAGLVDAVVVSYYDRLGRGSGKDQDRIFDSFLMGDVLIVELFPFNVYNVEDDASEEQIAFKQFMARRDLKTINKRMTMGRNAAIKLGRWVFSAVPYGYMYDKGEKCLIPHEENSKILRSIFEMYLTGEMSTQKIAAKLNEQKLTSPKGMAWHYKTINEILKNEVYTGVIVHSKSKIDKRAKKVKGKPKKRIYNPKTEWKKVNNTHDALISPEEYAKTMEIMDSKRTRRIGESGINYLSGVVKCYNCNKTLTIMKDKDRNDLIAKCYRCGKCRGGQADLVMETIYTSLNVLKKKLTEIDEDSLIAVERKSLSREIEEIQKSLTVNYTALENIEKAFEEGLYSLEKFKQKNNERKETIQELESAIATKNEQLKKFKTTTTKDKIKKIDDFLEQVKANEGDKAKVNVLIKNLFSSIIWKRTERGEVEIKVNFR